MLRVFPNPAADFAQVHFELDRTWSLGLLVYDLSGREVYRLDPQEYSGGSHELNLNTGGWGAGIYQIFLQSDQGVLGLQRLVVH